MLAKFIIRILLAEKLLWIFDIKTLIRFPCKNGMLCITWSVSSFTSGLGTSKETKW